MKTTKQKVETAVTAVDNLVRDMVDDLGLFCYASQSIIRTWSDIRRTVASTAADIINNKIDKNKEVFRSYGVESVGPQSPYKAVEDKSKTIELEKSNVLKRRFYIVVNKENKEPA